MKIYLGNRISPLFDKVSKVIGVLCPPRVKAILAFGYFENFSNSNFLPYINYCSLLWTSI